MQHFIEGVERARDYPYLDAHGVRVPSLDSKRYDGDTSVDKDGNYVGFGWTKAIRWYLRYRRLNATRRLLPDHKRPGSQKNKPTSQ
jgi:hypothetical protein